MQQQKVRRSWRINRRAVHFGRCPHPCTVSDERLNDPRIRIVVQRFVERGQALVDSVGVAPDGCDHQVNELAVSLSACKPTLTT